MNDPTRPAPTCLHEFRPGEVRCICGAHRYDCDCPKCEPPLTVSDQGDRHLGLTIRTNGWQGALDAISLATDGKNIAMRVGGVTIWVPPSQPAEVIS